MSSAAGPIVPLRTGSCALRPRAGSVSSKVLWVFSSMISKEPYMVRVPNQGSALARALRRALKSAPTWQRKLLGRSRRGGGAGGAGVARGCAAVLLTELVHAASCVDHLLLAGVERMAVRAHLDLQILAQGRTRLERVAARAGDGDLFVLRMDRGFHGLGSRGSKRGVSATWGGGDGN